MKRKLQREPGVEHALAAAGGSLIALARVLGISSPAIAKWERVPWRQVERIATKLPGTSRHIMRPDLYPNPGE